MIKRLLILLTVFLLCANYLPAQKKADSLINVLRSSSLRDTNRVKTLYLLGDAYKSTNPDSALKVLDESIVLSKELRFGKGLTNASSIKSKLLIAQGQVDDAIKLYDETSPLILEYGFPRGYCILQLQKGYAYMNSARPSEAIATFKSGIAETQKYEQHDALSDMYRGMGMSYASVGEHEKATIAFVQAIKSAERGSLPVQVGYTYITLGNSQTSQKDTVAALKSYRTALRILDTLHNDYGVAGCYICIGNVYLFQKRYDSALVNYQKCLDIRLKMNNDPGAVASVKENIATVFLEKGNPEKALPYFNEGLQVFTSLNNQEGIAGSYTNLGNAYLKMLNYQEAEKNFLAALNPARNSLANNFIKECYKGLSDVYYNTGRYKEAAEYKDSLIFITDIIVGEQHSAEAKEIEARFRNQQNEEQIAHLQETGIQQQQLAEKQKQIIIAVSVGLALVFFLMLFAVRANAQRKKANAKLSEQNILIAEKNKDITDSITYARRIQRSVLPDTNILYSNVSDAFIYYAPRDIVSGDFYWLRKEGSRLYIAAADCTGHGVPGALVSVIGVNLLEQIISSDNQISVGAALDRLHGMMYTAMHKDSADQGASDGMDIAIMCIDRATNTIEFSGASRPAYRFDGNSLYQLKGDRYSIGGVKSLDSELRFTTQRFPLEKGHTYYLFTDGFADQFGGSEGKKFMSKKFFDLISSLTAMNLQQQETALEKEFTSWKGALDQVDDVLVIGVRI